MKTKTGWYTFADGYSVWAMGMSAKEIKIEATKHGKLISFEPDSY